MPFYLVPAVTINDTTLVASNVPETDYTAWNAATAYNVGDRCIRTTGVHKIYQRKVAGTTATAPESDTTNWDFVSATNKFKMFDTSASTQTVVASPISVTITPGQAVTAVSLLGLVGTTARVRMTDPVAGTVFDTTYSITGTIPSADWFSYFTAIVQPLTYVNVLGLPPYVNCSVLIDISATSGNVSCGTCVLGYQIQLGDTEVLQGARAGIVDYSVKKTDNYGNTNLSVGAYAKRATFNLQVSNASVDSVADVLAGVRASPCMWIANTGFSSMQIFGIFQSYEVLFNYPTYSVLALDLLGLA